MALMRKRRTTPMKIISSAALVLAAIISMTFLNGIFSSPETYSGTIRTLDKQKEVATTLSIAVTAASTTLSTLPDDTASPVAAELADLSMPLFIVVCILYMEKFLLTTFGWTSCTVLVPLACLLLIINNFSRRKALMVYVRKLLILAIALVLIVPVSAGITTRIQDTFSESVSLAFDAVDRMSVRAGVEDSEDTNAFIAFFTGLKDNVMALVETAKNMLGVFTDAVAVLLITSCVIPVLTAVLFVWIIKIAFALNTPQVKVMHNALPSSRDIEKKQT